MNSEERQLLTDLFERMRAMSHVERDPEAEALIAQAVRGQPYAPYLMAQTVLIQEQALAAANERLEQLEAQLRGQETAPQRGSGSFLGGVRSIFGGSAPAPEPGARSSSGVPSIGSRATAYRDEGPGGPWASRAASDGPGYRGPQAGAPMQPQQAAPAAGGGFLKGALATAAGVAGGALLFQGISSMMQGSSNPLLSQAQAATPSSSEPSYAKDASDGNQLENGSDNAYDRSFDADDEPYDQDDGGSWGDDDY